MARDSFSLGMLVIIGAAIMLVISAFIGEVSGEDAGGTNFFLKASKSVPRIGRRSDYDNFYLKASKSVPRIGRRRELSPLTENRDWESVPWFRTADNIPGPSRRSDYYMHDEGHQSQPVSWNDIEKTMEMSPEMWTSDSWRKNLELSPLKDEYEIQHVGRRSAGTHNNGNVKRAAEDARSQAQD